MASAADRLIEGDPKSSVRVIIYEDLQCPDCADFRRMLDTQLLPRFAAKVAFEHRDFPLAKHAWARKAAIAARERREHVTPSNPQGYFGKAMEEKLTSMSASQP